MKKNYFELKEKKQQLKCYYIILFSRAAARLSTYFFQDLGGQQVPP